MNKWGSKLLLYASIFLLTSLIIMLVGQRFFPLVVDPSRNVEEGLQNNNASSSNTLALNTLKVELATQVRAGMITQTQADNQYSQMAQMLAATQKSSEIQAQRMQNAANDDAANISNVFSEVITKQQQDIQILKNATNSLQSIANAGRNVGKEVTYTVTQIYGDPYTVTPYVLNGISRGILVFANVSQDTINRLWLADLNFQTGANPGVNVDIPGINVFVVGQGSRGYGGDQGKRNGGAGGGTCYCNNFTYRASNPLRISINRYNPDNAGPDSQGTRFEVVGSGFFMTGYNAPAQPIYTNNAGPNGNGVNIGGDGRFGNPNQYVGGQSGQDQRAGGGGIVVGKNGQVNVGLQSLPPNPFFVDTDGTPFYIGLGGGGGGGGGGVGGGGGFGCGGGQNPNVGQGRNGQSAAPMGTFWSSAGGPVAPGGYINQLSAVQFRGSSGDPCYGWYFGGGGGGGQDNWGGSGASGAVIVDYPLFI